MIVTSVVVIFVLLGVLCFIGVAIGLIKLPDFYTRMHAAGIGDTMGTLLIIIGCCIDSVARNSSIYIQPIDILLFLKILCICVFVGIGSPTATNALMNVAYNKGEQGLTKISTGKKKDT